VRFTICLLGHAASSLYQQRGLRKC
jgi:hypothetical protein